MLETDKEKMLATYQNKEINWMPTEGRGMRQGCAYPCAPSSDTHTHLGEVPALDEVPGDVARGSAVHHGGDVVPGHPGCGVPVNEVWRQESMVELPQTKDMNVEKHSVPLLRLQFLGHGTNQPQGS